MANVLKMDKQTLIKQLLDLGWSYRRIHRETGIHRDTIAKYDPRHPKWANLPTDSQAERALQNGPKHALSAAEGCPPTLSGQRKPTRISPAQAYDAIIRERLKQQLSAQRIYQDLVVEHGYRASYDSVKRYVRKLKAKTPKLYARIHTAPGEEAQVDFGQGAPTNKNGRYVRPWLFKIVLSYSRHSYEEVVWSQDVETFIRCHEHAFAAFGGVPRLIRIDNLKSGVLKAHLYDPELNPLYAAFAKHAGFTPLPCLPGKPEHKGKTESGVAYTQNNALKGRRFESLQAQNAHLRYWNRTWARTRIHGTTKKQVWTLFTQEEKKTLQALPERAFQFFKLGSRKVQADGHIEVARAYYSVPHHYLGQIVRVQFNSQWVKVLDGSEVIAFHRTTQAGRFHTDKQHLPENKSLTTEQYQRRLLTRCSEVGSHCRSWAEKALEARQQLAFRAIQGVLHLRKSYADAQIDWACEQALKMDSLRYHTIKLLCQEPLESQHRGAQLPLLQEHELIRPPESYQTYFDQTQS
ncbi:IS21 family transposase [Candidatus Parcubacteria bacterium]|nr:MAG: IS21 family transposase [Candidatus Parcubacteria bacterium]